jgi:Cellulose biosynthesis GIL
MTPDRLAAIEVAASSLGVDNLPDRVARLAAGMIYSVACDQQAVRLPLLAGALAATLKLGTSCVLLTPSDGGMFLRKARLAGFSLDSAVRTGQLALFQIPPHVGKAIFRMGIETFVSQLQFGMPSGGAFLAVDCADPLFMLSDPGASEEAAQHYLHWASSHRHTLLATFAPAAVAPRDYLTLRHVAENFAGFAVARSTEGGAMLEIRHWFGAEGANPRESFMLRSRQSGVLAVRAPPVQDDELPPVDTVVYVQGAMDVTPAARASWHEAESIADAVDAARRSEAATLILPFDRPADYQTLCRAIVTVRAMRRPYLRVLVRERRVRLRAGQMLTLMRLGASAILPLDVSDSAVRRMVDSLRGTRFTRPYEMDAQQVDEDTNGLLARRPETAKGFCEAVEGLLAAADGFDIETSLVRVRFPDGQRASAARSARRFGRDVVAWLEGDTAWFFFFGCPAASIPEVLQRFFRAPIEGTGYAAEQDPERMLELLTELRRSAVTRPA